MEIPISFKKTSSNIIREHPITFIRTKIFYGVNIFLILYCIFQLIWNITGEREFMYFIFSLLTLLTITNMILFGYSKNQSIYKYVFIFLFALIIVIKSTPFTATNFNILLILLIPVISFSICNHKNATLITSFILILYAIIFFQKLIINYYDPSSIYLGLFVLIVYFIRSIVCPLFPSRYTAVLSLGISARPSKLIDTSDGNMCKTSPLCQCASWHS